MWSKIGKKLLDSVGFFRFSLDSFTVVSGGAKEEPSVDSDWVVDVLLDMGFSAAGGDFPNRDDWSIDSKGVVLVCFSDHQGKQLGIHRERDLAKCSATLRLAHWKRTAESTTIKLARSRLPSDGSTWNQRWRMVLMKIRRSQLPTIEKKNIITTTALDEPK